MLPLSEKKKETKFDDFRQGMKKVIFQEQEFLFLEQKIKEPQKLNLLPNFQSKTSSLELFKENNCRFLINGGFYDENDEPLGWFFTQEKLFKKESRNALFNGFLFKDKENKIFIDNISPSEPVIWGLQSGPILVFNHQPLKISLIRDQQARRMVATINQENELIFFVITSNESLVTGPFLVDLPKILLKIEENLGEKFQTAINLDGGTASAFINQDKIIKEYTWVGSFFCLSF